MKSQVRMFSIVSLFAVILFGSVFSLPVMSADQDKKEEEAPAVKERPKVDKTHISQYRSSKDRERHEIVSLHDEIQGYMNEASTLKGVEDEKEKRKAERKLKGLESKISRQQKALEKAVEAHLKDYRKVYEDNKKKYDLNEEKAKELEADGKTEKATKYHQESAKLSGAMESAKREIDVTEWFLFFDEK